jgi:hypothetical protein
MIHQYPPEFIGDARNLGAGKVILEEYEPIATAECPNCGGWESFYAWYVSSGPHRYMPTGQGSVKMIEGEWYTGELKSAPCPVCAGTKKQTWLERACGLEGIDLGVRISDFQAMKGKEQAREIACNLLEQVPNPAGFITFWGEFGTGKTTLLKALTNGFRVAGVLAVYVRMSDLLANVREMFGDNSKNAAENLLQEYRGVRALLIDEVDRVNMTSWATETMFRLLDGRYEARSRTLTVMATNKDVEIMRAEDGLAYLASRMKSGVVVEVGGVDVRPAIGLQATKEIVHK